MKYSNCNTCRRSFVLLTTLFLSSGVLGGIALSQSNLEERIDESEIANYLELFANSIIINRKAIKTWQGIVTVDDTSHYYNNQFDMVKKRGVNITGEEPSHISRHVSAQSEFMYDVEKKKLFMSFGKEKNNWSSANKESNYKHDYKISPQRSVVTPEAFMHYCPGYLYGDFDLPVTDGISAGRAGFIDPPENSVECYLDRVRHPKTFYMHGDADVGELLLGFAKTIRGDYPDIMGLPMVELRRKQREDYEVYNFICRAYYGSDENYISYREIELDSRYGFNPVQIVDYGHDGGSDEMHILGSSRYLYEKEGDCYYPIMRQLKLYSKDGLSYETTMTISDSVFNEAIPPEAFSWKNLNLDENARLIDNIRKLEFTCSNGELVPACNRHLVHPVVDELLDDIGGTSVENFDLAGHISSTKYDEKTHSLIVFMPSLSYAIKYGKPYILDIQKNKLRYLGKEPGEKGYGFLEKPFRGELVWDGVFLTRENSVIETSPETEQFIRKCPMNNTSIQQYYLSKENKVPFTVTVKTKRGIRYDLTVLSIEPRGIMVAYKIKN